MKMGWDYYTYMAQPLFFIEGIIDYLKAEHKAMSDSQRKQKRK